MNNSNRDFKNLKTVKTLLVAAFVLIAGLGTVVPQLKLE